MSKTRIYRRLAQARRTRRKLTTNMEPGYTPFAERPPDTRAVKAAFTNEVRRATCALCAVCSSRPQYLHDDEQANARSLHRQTFAHCIPPRPSFIFHIPRFSAMMSPLSVGRGGGSFPSHSEKTSQLNVAGDQPYGRACAGGGPGAAQGHPSPRHPGSGRKPGAFLTAAEE